MKCCSVCEQPQKSYHFESDDNQFRLQRTISEDTMTHSDGDVQKILFLLVMIGITLWCFEAALTFIFYPFHPLVLHSGTLINITAVKFSAAALFLFPIFVLLRVDQHDLWARRLVIALFIESLPRILLPSHTEFYFNNLLFRDIQTVLKFIFPIFNFIFTIYLFKPAVRSRRNDDGPHR